MTNAEAVNWLINITADIGKAEHSDLWHYEQALSEIREMLENAQPRHYHEENLLTYAHDMGVTLEQAKKELTRVSQIAPQRIKGRWLKKESVGRWDDTLWECSECGCLHRDDVFCISGDFNFCPNCGTDMRGDEDAAD